MSFSSGSRKSWVREPKWKNQQKNVFCSRWVCLWRRRRLLFYFSLPLSLSFCLRFVMIAFDCGNRYKKKLKTYVTAEKQIKNKQSWRQALTRTKTKRTLRKVRMLKNKSGIWTPKFSSMSIVIYPFSIGDSWKGTLDSLEFKVSRKGTWKIERTQLHTYNLRSGRSVRPGKFGLRY